MLMHDNVSGSGLLASEHKEELLKLKLISKQQDQERGEDGLELEEDDRWLLEVNLDDLETSSGEIQTQDSGVLVGSDPSRSQGASSSPGAGATRRNKLVLGEHHI
jgi:hypothetical protein